MTRASVNLWLSDSQYDVAVWLQERRRTRWLGERVEWAQERLVERPIKWLLCARLGHLPERDMCNLPQHDHCTWCGRSMPNAWVGSRDEI